MSKFYLHVNGLGRVNEPKENTNLIHLKVLINFLKILLENAE